MDPTDKSIPPAMSTNAMASTTKPSSPDCRTVSMMFGTETKFSIRELKKMMVTNKNNIGTIVSVHRLESNSPMTWSGHNR